MVRMFIYMPINDNPNAEGYVPPSIDVHGSQLMKAMVAARQHPDPNAAGGGHHNHNTPEMKAAKTFHQNAKGWIDVLAWSHGNSTKSMQDMSLTKYTDQYSPIFAVMVMTREVLPHCFLRVVGQPKDDKVNIIEYKLINCMLSSHSTGGSGGEDRLTENISIEFDAMNTRNTEFSLETGDKIFDSRGAWNDVTKAGLHDGVTAIPTLLTIAKRVVVENAGRYSIKHLRVLVKHKILNPQDIGLNKAAMELPIKGRRLLIATHEEVAGDAKKLKHFKELYLKELTFPALLKSIAAKLKRTESEVQRVSLLDHQDRLVEIDETDQVEDLEDSAALVVEWKGK